MTNLIEISRKVLIGTPRRFPPQKLRSPSIKTYVPLNLNKTSQMAMASVTSRDVRHYLPLVGKGSLFERHLRAQYLSHFGMAGLKRLNPAAARPFDVESARYNWIMSKNQVMDTQTNEMFKVSLNLLMELTPEASRIELGDSEDMSSRDDTTPPKAPFNLGEIPPIPHPLTSTTFEQYVHLLSHANFVYRNSSSATGLIPRLLLSLHDLNNSATHDLKSVTSYNNMIYFFGCKKKNMVFARELLLQMTVDNVQPNTATFNLFLRMLETHSKIRFTVHTYNHLNRYLRLMERNNLRANLETWEMAYNLITNDTHREIFLGVMDRLGLPLTGTLRQRVMRHLGKKFDHTDEFIRYLAGDSDTGPRIEWTKETSLIHIVMDHYLRNKGPNSLDRAYQLMVAHPELVTLKTIKLFHKQFARAERKDLSLAFYATHMRKWPNIKPDILVYHYMISCVVKSGYFQGNNSIIRMILAEMRVQLDLSLMEQYNLVMVFSYYDLSRQIQRSIVQHGENPAKWSLLDIRTELSETEQLWWTQISSKLHWDECLVFDPRKTRRFRDYYEIWRGLGVTMKDGRAKPKKKGIVDKKKMNKLKKKFKMKRILNIYARRAGLLKNGLDASFMTEMKQRGIIKLDE